MDNIRHRLHITLFGFKFECSVAEKSLQSLASTLQISSAADTASIEKSTDILVAVIKQFNVKELPLLAEALSSEQFSTVHKLAYIVNDERLSQQQVLCLHEIGAHRIFFGPKRDEEFKTHIKARSLAILEQGSIAQIESSIRLAALTMDHATVRECSERLLRLFPKEHEESLRLRALAHEATGELNKMTFCLKTLLRINPQSLWAANTLGRHYLKSGQIAEGIDLLQKLSQFHDLNAERIITLGDAYLNSGQNKEAKETYQKGRVLTEDQDERFKEGMAKTELASGFFKEALALIGKKYLSEESLSFLNTRAIIGMRHGDFEGGFKQYQMAIDGCDPGKKLLLAKLKFNLGFGYIRIKEYDRALPLFRESSELGGVLFNKANVFVDRTTKLIQIEKRKEQATVADTAFNDDDWEMIGSTKYA